MFKEIKVADRADNVMPGKSNYGTPQRTLPNFIFRIKRCLRKKNAEQETLRTNATHIVSLRLHNLVTIPDSHKDDGSVHAGPNIIISQ